MTKKSEDLQRQIAELEAQLAALKSHAASSNSKPEHTSSEGSTTINNSPTQGTVAGVISQSTINQFFGDKPPEDGEQLLQDYLHALMQDCNRLRLERMTEKRQSGAEQATTPKLKLQDVYTSLTTDGPDIVVHEMNGTIDRLHQWSEKLNLQDKSPSIYDPKNVRQIVCQDAAGASNHRTLLRVHRTGLPIAHLVRQSTYYPDELLTLLVVRPELAFDAIHQQHRLVLLGEPGSGKSTVLRYLSVLLARKLRGEEVNIPGWEEVDPLPVPIFCPLGQVAQALAETGNADEALWQTLGSLLDGHQPLRAGLREYLKGAINRGGVILLCDGLDELPQTSTSDTRIKPRRDIANAIRRLANDIPSLHIVLTSRVKPYYATGDWQMSQEEDWETRTIQPLAFGQVRTFIQSWYRALIGKAELLTEDEANTRSQQVISQIEEYTRLHPLIVSPLLLTMLVTLHYNKDKIPDNLVELYDECVQLLLDRWEPIRTGADPNEQRKLLVRLGNIPGLNLDLLRGVLHELAFQAHDQPPQDDGRGMIDGEKLDGKMYRFFARLQCDSPDQKVQIFRDVLEAEAGLLQIPAQDRYAFPHLTFQEYLAACYLIDHLGHPQEDMATLAYTRWCSSDAERWRKVLQLMMGCLHDKGWSVVMRDGVPWLKALVAPKWCGKVKPLLQRQRDLVLAALSYAEIKTWDALTNNWPLDIQEELVRPLRNGLVELLEHPQPQIGLDDRVAIANILRQIGDPRFPITQKEWQLEPFAKTFGNPKGYWCYIPAGTYAIGGWKEDKPAVDITLPDYWIARFPIIIAQFKPFIEIGYSKEAQRWWTLHGWQWKKQYHRTGPWGWHNALWTCLNRPIIGVNWYEAMAFVNWLDEQMTDVLPEGYRLRLPTEAEWEAAAAYDKVGTRCTYPWGETVPTWEHAVYSESRLGHTAPAGCCPNGTATCGALDMVGNVWEWTCSHGEHYPAASGQIVQDFKARVPTTVIRGGSWMDRIEQIFCGSRLQARPVVHNHYRGLRVVVARRSAKT